MSVSSPSPPFIVTEACVSTVERKPQWKGTFAETKQNEKGRGNKHASCQNTKGSRCHETGLEKMTQDNKRTVVDADCIIPCVTGERGLGIDAVDCGEKQQRCNENKQKLAHK